MMRLNRAVWAVVALSILQTSARGQSSPSPIVTTTASAPASSEFEPLDRWTVAVLAGDKTALAALYSTNPPSQVQTPQGKSEDSAGESAFWCAFAAKGIDKFEAKILEIQKPQPGVVALVLRIELTLGENPAEPYVVSAAQIWVQQDARSGNPFVSTRGARGSRALMETRIPFDRSLCPFSPAF
jgi:hypothetical protein